MKLHFFIIFEKLFDLACSQECGSRLTEPVGFIQSPNYPSPYPNNYQCSWIIGAGPTGKAFFFHLRNFFISIFSQNLRHGNDKRRRLQCWACSRMPVRLRRAPDIHLHRKILRQDLAQLRREQKRPVDNERLSSDSLPKRRRRRVSWISTAIWNQLWRKCWLRKVQLLQYSLRHFYYVNF